MYEPFQQKTMTGQLKNAGNTLPWHVVNASLAGKAHHTITPSHWFWNLKDAGLY